MTNNDPRLEKLADFLQKQIDDSSITDETIWHKMKLSKTTYYRLKPKAALILNTRLSQRQKELEHIKLQHEKEAVKQGLKTKSDRVLLLQSQIDDILSELKANTTFEYMVVQGRIQKVSRELTPTEKAHLRRSIKYIQSEISKIEGDYAPKKIQNVEPDTVLVPGEDEQ